MFCHRSEGASWLKEWKELMIKKNNYDFLRILYHQHHNFFRLRPGQAESRQSLVAQEWVLLGLAAAGGSVGAYLGMLVFRHKTLKPLFRFGVPVILLVHVVVAVYVWK